jgi:6,7-dimethyl-8-ribityllumazine synthase
MGQISQNSTDPLRIAFIKAGWHSDIVDQCYYSCVEQLSISNILHKVETYDVPGALEIPLLAKDLAKTGKYDAIIASAFIVNGGIYRHDFVSTAVIDGMMRVQLDTDIPVFSAVLTPHNFQESKEQIKFFYDHFKVKGKEVADACLSMLEVRNSIKAIA